MAIYNKLIFVSTANTSRSPMAETIYRNLDQNSDIEVVSRGLVVLFEEPVNPKAKTVLNNHELSMGEHVSKQLSVEEVDEHTLILTMNEKQKNSIINDFGITENIYTINEFAGEMLQIHDPYGGDLVEYEKCYQEIVRVVKKVIYKLQDSNNL